MLTVKAYPTESKKYGSTVCAAGITEDGEWIRLYPIPYDLFFEGENRFPKYCWIEVECKKDDKDILRRKESHKVKKGSIRLIDDSLTVRPIDWKKRNELVLAMQSRSIEELRGKWEEDRTSLGLIRPKVVSDLVFKRKQSESESTVQLDLFEEEASIVTPMDVVIRYAFTCADKTCTGHKIMCEDWELGEAWRKWKRRYGDGNVLEAIIRKEFFDDKVNKRDLYFYMGMYYIHPAWLIIGLYYPPKKRVRIDESEESG